MWKVLLVEDEVFVRESVREIISWEELGYTVIGESGNGTEALAMIIQDTPDLVLTDIVMPGMDGLELLKQTRQAGLKTKFIMLTCMGEFEYVRRAMEYGASNYILKLSMSVNSLRDTLRKVSAELGTSAEERMEEGHQEVSSPTPLITSTSASLTISPEPLSETDLPFIPVREPVVKHPEISKIIEYIGQHYDQDITVKSMSRYVMMGENYVSALFKKKTGHTLIHYLHGVRMEKAAEYLRETNLPVQEIGYRVGFGSDNYFIKIFKRWTGCTPSQYRHRS
ncbi:YesN/AraC family two-component response regulator [Paenibacillus amylolyticus]|uniref:YesN/AraC family two-component response regulator n=1 Tax=Paenibacillus amylolyticus TaxID=1451 RepID=A0AAP5H5P8_PAEAM|nr:response regulator [Paenibacillus amylolyticus]MDR6724426.1 YesN/AraC family two-component response regulator [Paenibacillus amylolyticus]